MPKTYNQKYNFGDAWFRGRSNAAKTLDCHYHSCNPFYGLMLLIFLANHAPHFAHHAHFQEVHQTQTYYFSSPFSNNLPFFQTDFMSLLSNIFFTSRRLSHRLVSVKKNKKKKRKKGTFAFWFSSFIICLVLNSDLACNCCLQFLLVIFACFEFKFYLQVLLAIFTCNFYL